MIFSSCSSQNRPAVVMPVDDEVGIAEEADHDGDEEGGYRRRVLDKKPS